MEYKIDNTVGAHRVFSGVGKLWRSEDGSTPVESRRLEVCTGQAV